MRQWHATAFTTAAVRILRELSYSNGYSCKSQATS
jgi:hypothetical protein